MFTDTHCHIFKEDYSDIEKIINNAITNKVNRLIVSGFNYQSNVEALKLAKKFQNVYLTLGQHPCNLEDIEKNLKFIEKNINFEKVLGIGEIGLDYHYDNYDKTKQIKIFNKMMSLAVKYQKPVVIHSRDAQIDTFNILKNYKIKGIIHSFTENLEIAKQYINLGYLLGINGIITFKNSNLSTVLNNISIKYILLETDSPYLAPEPLRSTKNEPANIIYIAQKIAEIYKIDLKNLSKKLESNLLDIFDIKWKIC